MPLIASGDLEQSGTLEASGRHGGGSAATAQPLWAAAAASLCLLATLGTGALPRAAEAEGPAAAPPPAEESGKEPKRVVGIQVLTEDGKVLGEDTVAGAPDAPRRRKGTEARQAPEVPEEERVRRREAPSEQVMEEMWYKRGKIVFVAKCAGCHPAGTNTISLSKSLFWDDMERNGYRDFEKVKQIIRYGKGKMPGYAEDCAAEQDYTQCGVISTLDEETIRDVEDFMLNRANAGWKGRG